MPMSAFEADDTHTCWLLIFRAGDVAFGEPERGPIVRRVEQAERVLVGTA
jgi:hypothetical protein